MNFNDWPTWKKDQYREENSKKILRQRFKQRREEVLDERLTPAIWKFPLNERNVFKMLAYTFPINETITKILQRFFTPEGHRTLLLSSRYLFESKKISPFYYSDRERIVVMLNRLRATEDYHEFVNWLSFQKTKQNQHLLFLIGGVIFLDQYLDNLDSEHLLNTAIKYLYKAHHRHESEESSMAYSSLMAFCLYMKQDFKGSISYLKNRKENDFQAQFSELLLKAS
jgi:hypothetical protein